MAMKISDNINIGDVLWDKSTGEKLIVTDLHLNGNVVVSDSKDRRFIYERKRLTDEEPDSMERVCIDMLNYMKDVERRVRNIMKKGVR